MSSSRELSRDRARRRGAAPALALAMAAVLLAWTPPSRAELYRWVDENGDAHYTTDLDRVPRHLRGRIRHADPESDAEREEQAPGERIPGPLMGTPPWLLSIPGPRESSRVAAPSPAPERLGEIPGPLIGTSPAIGGIPGPLPADRVKSPAPAAAVPRQRRVSGTEGDEIWDIPGARPAPIPEPVATPHDAPETATDASDAELRAQVIQDRETLKRLVSAPEAGSEGWLSNPELREIAERLRELSVDREPDPDGD